MFEGKRCRERLPLKPTSANLKRAENHRASILYAISQGVFDYVKTFPNSARAQQFAPQQGGLELAEVYFERWLCEKRSCLHASTFRSYRHIVENRLIPWFGRQSISSIDRASVRQKLRALAVSNKTLSNIQSVLRSALQDAIDANLISANPLAGWRYSVRTEVKEAKASDGIDDDAIDPFTKAEQASIANKLPPQGANLIAFAFWTGLRTSELVALNWRDIDLERCQVSISKAKTQAAAKPETPKTKAGLRKVKLLEPAVNALRAQAQFTRQKGEEVFQNPRTGQRWTGDQAIRKTLWKPALASAGVRYRKPYSTRHTFASMMLSAGENPMWVAKQMGHADWTMIVRTYGRWMTDADPTAGAKAQAKFASSVAGRPEPF